jgi:hypothetical protein
MARNIALTVNNTTIVRPASHLPGCKKAARKARENRHTVSLKWTDEPETDLTVGLKSSGSCEDCECCGGFGARAYWIETEWSGVYAWACSRCVGIHAVRKLAAHG